MYSIVRYDTHSTVAAKAAGLYEICGTYIEVSRQLEVDELAIARDLKRLGYLSKTQGKVQDFGPWRITTLWRKYLTGVESYKIRNFISHRHYNEDGTLAEAWLTKNYCCIDCNVTAPKGVLWMDKMIYLSDRLGDASEII